MAALIAGGETPLEYMLRIARDPTVNHDRRDRMANAAAPYMHPRLASTEVSGDQNKPIQHKLKIQFVAPGDE